MFIFLNEMLKFLHIEAALRREILFLFFTYKADKSHFTPNLCYSRLKSYLKCFLTSATSRSGSLKSPGFSLNLQTSPGSF